MGTVNDDNRMQRKIRGRLIAVNVTGIILSAYAHYVSISKKSKPDYEAMCDISESMSCSRVLTSPYSTGFGFLGQLLGESSILNQSNSTMGLIFYTTLLLMSFSDRKSLCKLQLALSVLSNIGSVYLAFILYVLRDFCLVCVSTYVANAANLILAYQKFNSLNYINSKKED